MNIANTYHEKIKSNRLENRIGSRARHITYHSKKFLVSYYSYKPTPGSPSKFLMAAFVRIFAQKMTAEICPVEPLRHFIPPKID